jgi:hypothetical protein
MMTQSLNAVTLLSVIGIGVATSLTLFLRAVRPPQRSNQTTPQRTASTA